MLCPLVVWIFLYFLSVSHSLLYQQKYEYYLCTLYLWKFVGTCHTYNQHIDANLLHSDAAEVLWLLFATKVFAACANSGRIHDKHYKARLLHVFRIVFLYSMYIYINIFNFISILIICPYLSLLFLFAHVPTAKITNSFVNSCSMYIF